MFRLDNISCQSHVPAFSIPPSHLFQRETFWTQLLCCFFSVYIKIFISYIDVLTSDIGILVFHVNWFSGFVFWLFWLQLHFKQDMKWQKKCSKMAANVIFQIQIYHCSWRRFHFKRIHFYLCISLDKSKIYYKNNKYKRNGQSKRFLLLLLMEIRFCSSSKNKYT